MKSVALEEVVRVDNTGCPNATGSKKDGNPWSKM